jgi:hypothetical protein
MSWACCLQRRCVVSVGGDVVWGWGEERRGWDGVVTCLRMVSFFLWFGVVYIFCILFVLHRQYMHLFFCRVLAGVRWVLVSYVWIYVSWGGSHGPGGVILGGMAVWANDQRRRESALARGLSRGFSPLGSWFTARFFVRGAGSVWFTAVCGGGGSFLCVCVCVCVSRGGLTFERSPAGWLMTYDVRRWGGGLDRDLQRERCCFRLLAYRTNGRQVMGWVVTDGHFFGRVCWRRFMAGG